jgi:hypothetical protein
VKRHLLAHTTIEICGFEFIRFYIVPTILNIPTDEFIITEEAVKTMPAKGI